MQLLVFDSTRLKKCLRGISCCGQVKSEKLHKAVRRMLMLDGTWPPVGETTTAETHVSRDVIDEVVASVTFVNDTSRSNGLYQENDGS